MGSVISLSDKKAELEAKQAALKGYTVLADGGFRLGPDGNINELRRIWRGMKEELEVYREDVRRSGGVPFCDM